MKQLAKNELQQFATTVQRRIVSGRPMKDKKDASGFAAKVDTNVAAFQPCLEKTGTSHTSNNSSWLLHRQLQTAVCSFSWKHLAKVALLLFKGGSYCTLSQPVPLQLLVVHLSLHFYHTCSLFRSVH